MSTNKSAKLIAGAGRRDRNRKILFQGGVALALVALIAVIGVSVAGKKKDKDDKTAAQAAAAAGPAVFDKGALRFGNPDGKVVLTVTEDFQCPACKLFEATTGPTIDKLLETNKITVDYQPVAWLDDSSTTAYSSRAANAAACVADAGKSKWLAWQKLMYDKQPAEQTAGLTDDQLVGIAKQAGVDTPAVAECIKSEKYAAFVTASTDRNFKNAKLGGTPNAKVNGEQVGDPGKVPTTEQITAAIAAASAKSK